MPVGPPNHFLWIGLACFIVIWLPGHLLARFARLPRPTDWPLRTAAKIGLGLAFWPLLLLWSTPLVRVSAWNGWSVASARVVIAGMATVTFALVVYDLRHHHFPPIHWFRRQAVWLALFFFLLLLAIVTRWLHARTLVLPNWIDSVHHVMVARLIVHDGALPHTYEPYIVDSVFSYHWGFHALIAWVAWLLDLTKPTEIARLTLSAGQAVNILMLWTLYAAGRALFNSRRAGFLAAALGMFVSWMPAYYTAWGRYTHLTGILLAVPFLIALWRLAFTRTNTRGWWVVAVLTAAGLSLTHIRIAAFAALFATLMLVWILLDGLRNPGRDNHGWRVVSRWTTASAAALVLITPWILRLSSHPHISQSLISPHGGYLSWNDVISRIPWGLVWVPGVRTITTLATGGISEFLAHSDSTAMSLWSAGLWLLILIAIAIWNSRRTDRHNRFPWAGLALLYLWSVSLFFLLSSQLVGIPQIGFLSLSAAAITFFAPASLAAAGITTWATGAIIPLRWLKLSAVAITVSVALWGAANMRDIVNPSTVLTDPEDLTALEWVCENTPPEARYAVDTWRWQGTSYAGGDAGYWIPVLCDRDSIVPPAIYAISSSREQIMHTDSILEEWTAAQSGSNDEVVRAMRAHDLSHLFVGRRTRHLDPIELARSPDLELLYDADSVYVFRLKAGEMAQETTP